MDEINYSKIKRLEKIVIQNDLDINKRVKVDVPEGAEFTDTVTTINGNVGIITKEDIVALGIPSQDTVIDISGKVDKVPGKGLSTNDYSDEEKQKNQDSHNSIGELSKLPTDEKGNLVGAIGEVKDDLAAHKEDYIQHLISEMPHLIKDDDTGKIYRVGRRFKDGGMQTIWEEVI